MGLWDTIGDAVKSLPEAAVLREHVAFLRDQFAAMERKAKDLETKDTISQQKIAHLEAEKQSLELDKTNLQEQVRNLEEQLSARSRDRLELLKERILNLLVSTSHETSSVLAEELETNEELINFHLMEMKKAKLVLSHPSLGESSTWTLAQEGRRYLITHGLLQEVIS